MVIPDAIAYSCAVISTKIAYIPEIVKDNYNGFLLKPGQIDRLKEKILFLDKNRGILVSFIKNRPKISSDFSLIKYINKLLIINNFNKYHSENLSF